ncbi:MAG: hypothetical protein AAF380_00675 [Bacteroidota bacterium]
MHTPTFTAKKITYWMAFLCLINPILSATDTNEKDIQQKIIEEKINFLIAKDDFKTYLEANSDTSFLFDLLTKKNIPYLLQRGFFLNHNFNPASKKISNDTADIQVHARPYETLLYNLTLSFFFMKLESCWHLGADPHALVTFKDAQDQAYSQSPISFIASPHFEELAREDIKESLSYGFRTDVNHACKSHVGDKVNALSIHKLDFLKSRLIEFHLKHMNTSFSYNGKIAKPKEETNRTLKSIRNVLNKHKNAEENIAPIIWQYQASKYHKLINVIDNQNHTALDYVINNPNYPLTKEMLRKHGAIIHNPVPYQEANNNLHNHLLCPHCLEPVVQAHAPVPPTPSPAAPANTPLPPTPAPTGPTTPQAPNKSINPSTPVNPPVPPTPAPVSPTAPKNPSNPPVSATPEPVNPSKEANVAHDDENANSVGTVILKVGGASVIVVGLVYTALKLKKPTKPQPQRKARIKPGKR